MNGQTTGSSPNLTNNVLYVSPFEGVNKEAAAQQALFKTEDPSWGFKLAATAFERILQNNDINEDVLTPKLS